MQQPLFSIEERERRLRIVEAGIKDEFWKTLSDSMMVYCAVKTQEAVELMANGKKDDAERIAIEIEAIRRIVAEPATIIRINKPLFDKYVASMCKACGHVTKKLRQIIKGEEGENVRT